MNDKLHVIITGNTGKTIRFPVPRKRVIIGSAVTLFLTLILTISSIYSFSLMGKNIFMSRQITELRSIVKKNDVTVLREELQKAKLEKQQLAEEVSALKEENSKQIATFNAEKEELLSTAVSELQEKSMVIDTIMDNIGVKLKTKKSQKNLNSGGPFIEYSPGLYDDLLLKVDAYDQQVRYLPLGWPVKGKITSYFGRRQDPINNRVSYHEGIDIKGPRGKKIYATAAGKVVKAYRNPSYGNFVTIDHRNGYTTAFAHMDKFFVKEGQWVQRGQLIGYLGNTGRSTGAHLHFELRHKGTPVNPLKFMQVAKLTVPRVKTVKVCKPSKIMIGQSKAAAK